MAAFFYRVKFKTGPVIIFDFESETEVYQGFTVERNATPLKFNSDKMPVPKPTNSL